MAGTPKYFLHYFDMRGRGEPVRWILNAIEVDYEEERIAFSDWQIRKADFDFGKIPVLDVNGEQLYQTLSICRYLGKTHNLAPSDPWENARIEEVAETVHDVTALMSAVLVARRNNIEEGFEEKVSKSKDGMLQAVKNVEKTITKDGWIRSKKMTWVDIFVASYMDMADLYDGIFDEAPKVQSMLNKVRKLPSIQKWLKSRPPLKPYETAPESK